LSTTDQSFSVVHVVDTNACNRPRTSKVDPGVKEIAGPDLEGADIRSIPTEGLAECDTAIDEKASGSRSQKADVGK
jgi:hypothetical protein